jgi:selenoprotein W-related protein
MDGRGLMTDKRSLSIEYCTLTLIPSSGGVYEITFGGELIYSKKATGEFPEPEQIVKTVAAG